MGERLSRAYAGHRVGRSRLTRQQEGDQDIGREGSSDDGAAAMEGSFPKARSQHPPGAARRTLLGSDRSGLRVGRPADTKDSRWKRCPPFVVDIASARCFLECQGIRPASSEGDGRDDPKRSRRTRSTPIRQSQGERRRLRFCPREGHMYPLTSAGGRESLNLAPTRCEGAGGPIFKRCRGACRQRRAAE
jgi:hypothetical protein